MIVPESELILNKDGSIFHLALLPEEIADIIITVGDPERVSQVSKYFDRIEVQKQKREFITHTGYIGQLRITVLSTGIGVGNIDIVLNELDALANIDLSTRQIKRTHKKLKIIRVGTAGGVQAHIPLDSWVTSVYAFGFDRLTNFYADKNQKINQSLADAFNQCFREEAVLTHNYLTSADQNLLNLFADKSYLGLTATLLGFYGPQGRAVRLRPAVNHFIEKLQSFSWQNLKFINLEMETAAIYLLANLLDHEAVSISTILANRATRKFSTDPRQSVENLISYVLDKITRRFA